MRPRLTCEMVARLQGWQDDWGWRFGGRKTARYRQIGNAFPPPVAEALGSAIRRALEHAGDGGGEAPAQDAHVHDPCSGAAIPGRLPDRPADRQLCPMPG